MKLIRLLILILVFLASKKACCQTKVTLNYQHAHFEEIITAIQQQTVYRFIYRADQLPNQPITISVKDAEVLSLLDNLLKGTHYYYKLTSNNLIAIGTEKDSVKSIAVSGMVTDEQGLPISGASVRIKNSNYGTETDNQGRFVINSANGAVIEVSSIGYNTQQVIITPIDQTLKITLQSSYHSLDEVVVTALNIKKENWKVGYSVASIPGSDLTVARESNVAMSLEGQVAGLTVSGTNGGPASSSRLLLRGAASMNAGSPLLVLDGVPIDNTQRGSANEYGGADYGDGFSNINPDDIESITVLKGSAASALYGARAANGVILINTKTGEKNSSTLVEYNLNLSFDHAINNTDFQYEYGQGSQNQRPQSVQSAIASGLLSWGEKLDGKPTIQTDGNYYPYSAVKNNIEAFYGTAPALTNTISVSGGNAKAAFRASASNLEYESIVPNSGLNRKTFNLNTSYDITDKLKFSFNGNYIYEMAKTRSYLSDGPMNANYGIEFLATSANQLSLKPGYNPVTGNESQFNSNVYITNPYFVVNKQVDNTTRNRFITATVLKYNFTDNVYLQGRLGYDISNDGLLNVLPTGTAFTVNEQGGLNGLSKSQTSELNTDLLFVANKKLTDDLKLNFSAGGNYRQRQYNLTEITGSQFITPYLYTPSNLVSSSSSYDVSEIVTESAYYSADFDFKNLLDIAATGRYDIFSTLPPVSRGIFVPGVSGSFLFSNLLALPYLSSGKFRISYAKTSGEPSQPYTTQLYFTSNNTVNGIPLGSFSPELPNYNLKPFTLTEFETGVNLSFFQNRLTLDATYFNRITHNEITNAQQSVATGFTSAYVNVGKTKNTGVELMLSGGIIRTANFSWNSSINFSQVHNVLLSIDGSSQYLLTGTYRPLNANTALVVGKSITQVMAYDYKRDSMGNIIIGSDGIPERGDLKAMGGTLPTFYGGFTNSFRYKKFNFSFLIDYKFGNKVLSATEDYSYVYGLNKATLVGRETGIVAKGVNDNGQINTINVPAYNYYPQLATNISALSVLNGSFIKFRQLIFGYDFTPPILGNLFRSVTASLVGRNIFTILKYTKNIDPESEFSSELTYAGIEGESLPATRTLGFNLNFKFK
ncbi:SusC/RagA family TonB-linked outer membrane protein [Mucilaginibacter sp. X4EP1]|uniref:SusC/RagA family TonB-linked outer membrane protein n=1 Tax=Mucilaginibacter sp. X4EP1 TaxID=2723092 RepID=UPI00216A4BAF|nr:SusC/RagA family TonB-linked outer membrane protein [Mucilaginibacter sp. X4EP1]MCS3812361.1 TonB-linked SusC/RagA family outer membrane protein [Mucilaginibacter sp. X4EP1]